VALSDVLQVLYLFVPAYVANMVPVLAKGHFESLARPIDGGLTFRGKRVLGDHKTWRGLLAGVVAGVIAFELQHLAHAAGPLHELALIDYPAHPVLPGLLMGLGALVGDAVKSFFKRQVGIRPGASWLGFDQLDFYLGAWLFLAPLYPAPLVPMLASVPIVFAGDMVTNALAFQLGLKESWI
jgi:CDP-2,3-bis-(O-geranylgeranyl)-sn-glycerol synthase